MNEKTKPLVPKLRFPEFRDAGDWNAKALEKYTTKIGSGITPRGGDKNYRAEGRPFVRSQNVGWGELILDDIVYIDEETHSSFSSTEIMANDVLLNISGASIGRSSIANDLIAGGNVNQHVCIIRAKMKKLTPLFLNQFLLSQEGQKQIDSFQAGGNRQGLNFGQIRSFSIPFPSTFEEQQKIAECLSSLDALIAAQTEKIDALKTHKKGLMQQLFPREGETIPRLRFSEFRDLGEWEEKSISDCCHLQAGKFVRANNIYEVASTNRYPCYGGNGLRGYTTSFTHEGQYPLIGRQGAHCGNVNLAKGKFYATEHAVVVTPKYGVSTLWLFYKLTQMNLNQHATGQAQPGLSVENIEKLIIKIPENEEEQQKITDCLSSLDALIAAQEEKINALKDHKKGLMQQLFPNPEAVV